MYNLEGNYKV